MALAGNDQYVARTHSGHRGGNGRPPIADLLRARGLGQYLLANCGRILAARIVVGDDGAVGQRRGDASHDLALAAVAVAAAADAAEEFVLRVGAQRLPHGFQRIGCVRLVDLALAPLWRGADPLDTAVPAGKLPHAGPRPVSLAPS